MPGFAINNTSSETSIDHRAEFHRAHRWRIESLGTSPATRTEALGRGSSVFRPKLYAKTLELPSLSFENELVAGANLKYKFPKRPEWENITVSFYDVYGLHDVLRFWQETIWSPEEGLGLADEYKGDAKFVLTNGKGRIFQTYTLVGCYPTKVSHSELSAASSEIKLLHVTYAFDYATIDIEDLTPRDAEGVAGADTQGRAIPAPGTSLGDILFG